MSNGTKVFEKFFIGSSFWGKDLQILKDNGITTVVNIAEDYEDTKFEGIKYHKVGLYDNGEDPFNTGKYLEAAITVISALQKGETVVLHCHEGKSRTIAIAILVICLLEIRTMLSLPKNVDDFLKQKISETHKYLCSIRPIASEIRPNHLDRVYEVLRNSVQNRIKTKKTISVDINTIKLGLASNFQDEVGNIEAIWNTFKNIIDKWVVVDSGSTDGTQEKLKELVGDKLILIESDMIKSQGYGYSRTKLVEFSEGMDWVLIWDGDERMLKEDVDRIKDTIASNYEYDMIRLPRCHWQDWEMTKVEYGSMDKIGNDYKQAITINPDWQPRLIKRTILEGKSKVQFYRRVHEWVKGVNKEHRDLGSPVIQHFGWCKSDERKKMVANLCDTLWKLDQSNAEIKDTYVKENAAGTATVSNPWNSVPIKEDK